MAWRETPSGILVPDDSVDGGERVVSGVCHVCGCTEDSPCEVPAFEHPFETCFWVDETETLCSNCVGKKDR